MATQGIKTAADLSLAVGKWVKLVSADEIDVNTSPGTASLGVLVKVETLAGIQWGQVDSGVDVHRVESGAAFAKLVALTNDATGRSVLAVGPDAVLGISLESAAAAGEFALAFPFSGGVSSGGGGGALPATEIGFGDGVAIVSSPNLTFDPSFANILQLKDTAGDVVVETGGLAATARFFNIKDENGQDVLAVDACLTAGPPKRAVTINIEGDGALATFRTLVGEQFVQFGDGSGQTLVVDVLNDRLQALSATPAVVWEINWDTGKPLTFADIATATASNGGLHGDGQSCFIESILKPTEITPNGTGAVVYWSSAGPSGAGWYKGDQTIATE